MTKALDEKQTLKIGLVLVTRQAKKNTYTSQVSITKAVDIQAWRSSKTNEFLVFYQFD